MFLLLMIVFFFFGTAPSVFGFLHSSFSSLVMCVRDLFFFELVSALFFQFFLRMILMGC